MPSANRISTPVAVDLPEIEGRYAPVGDYTVGFETFKQDADPAPYFVGLPDDRCQCPHWGVVTAGQLTFRWADREETFMAGDAYYAPPGHLPLFTEGTTLVEFSPTADLEATMAVVEANLMGAEARGMTAQAAPARPDTTKVVADLVRFLETGSVPDGLFAPDVFADLTLPHWRVQTDTAKAIIAERVAGHPATGQVHVERVERTDHGFTIEFEERWEHEGQRWYCREMIRADVVGDRIVELSIYCTGDWDEKRQREHAAAVRLLRV